MSFRTDRTVGEEPAFCKIRKFSWISAGQLPEVDCFLRVDGSTKAAEQELRIFKAEVDYFLLLSGGPKAMPDANYAFPGCVFFKIAIWPA
jgi:hypothetical protein